ncbi:MAG: asparagine synthase (glutamine-hydrolyzing) [Cyclobacteriaceae bacterium]|nr:asparagine synthase (glutamine-hydrolyzing) [Cyclobacteriaceae bacterium]
MCGFLFEFSNKRQLEPDAFYKLLSLSRERGPDHSGYWTNDTSVQIGFNRLAILELTTAGNQPMLSRRQRYVVVFNGEVYNHLELRTKLSYKDFKGQSDTETLCACLDEWGLLETIEKLDGMFAFVVFDQLTGIISLVRDFAGIKPLYYGWDGNTLVAASQYDQVVRHPTFAKQLVDYQVLKLYLQQHFVPAPFGLIRSTFQVEPGEIVQLLPEGRVSKKKYWSFPEFIQPSISEQSEALVLIDESLSAAVKAELLSDVPVGAFLSGGIDSPLICFYAQKHLEYLKTFTAGSDSAVHNEAGRASQYSRLLGTFHTTAMMDDVSVKELFPSVLKCMHEPMADFSIIPTFLVSQLSRNHVSVALSGDGSDELFFGYERFWSIAKNIRYQQLPWVIKAGLYKTDQWLSGNKHINSIVLSPSQAYAHQQLHSRFSQGLLDKLFPDLAAIEVPSLYNTYSYPTVKDVSSLIMHMRRAEFYGMMQKTLRKVDLASMGNSLEVRVPFLKKSLIEASLKIDPFLNYGPEMKKHLLKNLLQTKVPGSPIDNVKRGFSIPLGHWIRKELKDQFQGYLIENSFLNRYGISKPAAQNLMEQHMQGKDLKWPIFTLASLNAWHHNLSA